MANIKMLLDLRRAKSDGTFNIIFRITDIKKVYSDSCKLYLPIPDPDNLEDYELYLQQKKILDGNFRGFENYIKRNKKNREILVYAELFFSAN